MLQLRPRAREALAPTTPAATPDTPHPNRAGLGTPHATVGPWNLTTTAHDRVALDAGNAQRLYSAAGLAVAALPTGSVLPALAYLLLTAAATCIGVNVWYRARFDRSLSMRTLAPLPHPPEMFLAVLDARSRRAHGSNPTVLQASAASWNGHTLTGGGLTVTFLTDEVLVGVDGAVGGRPWDAWTVDIFGQMVNNPTSVRMGMPTGHTWKHARFDGSPDPRARDNQRIAVELVCGITLHCQELTIFLFMHNASEARQLLAVFPVAR